MIIDVIIIGAPVLPDLAGVLQYNIKPLVAREVILFSVFIHSHEVNQSAAKTASTAAAVDKPHGGLGKRH